MGSLTDLLSRWRNRDSGSGPGASDDVRKYIEELGRGLDEVKKTTMALAERLDKLAKTLVDLSREVGKLSDTFGFVVEDVARSLLPTWLNVNMGIYVKSLNRAFFDLGEKVVEVDFYGEGIDNNGESLLVFGEAKARIHGEDVKAFHDKVQQIIRLRGNPKNLLLMYGLYIHPSAMQEALRRGIVVVSPYITLSIPRENVSRTIAQ